MNCSWELWKWSWNMIHEIYHVPLTKQVYVVICVHAWETYRTYNHARVNLYEMSTYKSWRGDRLVSFLKMHELCQTWLSQTSFWNSQTQLTNIHFPWPNELMICPYNALQTRITASQPATHLLHEFILNVKCRMVWFQYRQPITVYICFLFNFLKQYPANWTCLTSVNMYHQRILNIRKQWK